MSRLSEVRPDPHPVGTFEEVRAAREAFYDRFSDWTGDGDSECWMCLECGAIVGNWRLHLDWHEKS